MRTTQGRVTFSVVGLGGRASAYLSALQEYYPEKYRVVAVADPNPTKQARAKNEYGLGDHQIFNTDLELMAQPRLSDVAIIATQDKLHLRDLRGLLEKGYGLILEKPVATTLEELKEVASLSKAFPDQMAAVCHVLRHSPFLKRSGRSSKAGALARWYPYNTTRISDIIILRTVMCAAHGTTIKPAGR